LAVSEIPFAMETEETQTLKADMRREAIARRRLAYAANPDAGRELADLLLATVAISSDRCVSGYWPMGEEMDIRPTLNRLFSAGHRIGLPVVVREGQPLAFREWRPGMALVRARFNVDVPPAEAPEVTPSVLLVPLLAFDRLGFRVGYGGGFYDRTLAAMRERRREVLSVGIAYAAQQVAQVPRGPYDQALDWIATERWARKVDSAAPWQD
jgi:5-formyltetrahydrofolate cyclo-ligase